MALYALSIEVSSVAVSPYRNSLEASLQYASTQAESPQP